MDAIKGMVATKDSTANDNVFATYLTENGLGHTLRSLSLVSKFKSLNTLLEMGLGLLFAFPPGEIIEDFLPPFVPFPAGVVGVIRSDPHSGSTFVPLILIDAH